MKSLRIERINSLLREVISEVIRKELKNPKVQTEMVTVTEVKVTKDLRYAKVYVSILLEKKEQNIAIETLKQSAGFIAVQSSQKVRLRFFPQLSFLLDESAERASRIETLLNKVLEGERKDEPEDLL